MDSQKSIFVIDDDESVRTVMERYLTREGYVVESFATAEAAMQKMQQQLPAMFILDIMLPGMSGYDLCKWIRLRSDVPIIMVSARDEEVDRILGLELGSDDYLSKPFSPRELVARVRTVFRRMRGSMNAIENEAESAVAFPNCADLVLREEERRIMCKNTEVSLTSKEFELLEFLIKNKSKAFTREQLLSQVWGYEFIGDERAIDDLVKRLRKKISYVNSTAEIVTVWGFGYKLEG